MVNNKAVPLTLSSGTLLTFISGEIGNVVNKVVGSSVCFPYFDFFQPGFPSGSPIFCLGKFRRVPGSRFCVCENWNQYFSLIYT